MQAISAINSSPRTIAFAPMGPRGLSSYMERAEIFQEMQDNGIGDVFKEAEAHGFDQVMLRLLVRERRMSLALDDFLARRLESEQQ